MAALPAADQALLELGRELQQCGYRFTTITPATHARVNARNPEGARSLEDIFGWSRSFRQGDVPDSVIAKLATAGELASAGSVLGSRVRFSTLDGQLFIHSAFPTEQSDAVFFGPDSYRFARLIRQTLATFKAPARPRVLDVGAGSGVGGLTAGALLADTAPIIVLADINDRALRFSRINALLNGISDVDIRKSDLFSDISGSYDLIISNPPYLVDPLGRAYRHGGGAWGADLSLKIYAQGIKHLAPGGRLVLYTGTAMVGGVDPLYEHLSSLLGERDLQFTYEEIDPDVFGEELEHPPYDRVDRIAVVAITVNYVEESVE
jgi:methylase of polypeptide subunit release factors